MTTVNRGLPRMDLSTSDRQDHLFSRLAGPGSLKGTFLLLSVSPIIAFRLRLRSVGAVL